MERLGARRRLRAVRRLAGRDGRAAARARAARAGSAATASAGPPTRTPRPTTRSSRARSPRRARRSARTSSPTSPRCRSRCRSTARCLPRLAAQRRPLVRCRRTAARTRSCSTAPTRRGCVFGHTHLPFARHLRRRDRARQPRLGRACRSTATRARPTRCSHDDGRIEHRRVAYDHARARPSASGRSARIGRRSSRGASSAPRWTYEPLLKGEAQRSALVGQSRPQASTSHSRQTRRRSC